MTAKRPVLWAIMIAVVFVLLFLMVKLVNGPLTSTEHVDPAQQLLENKTAYVGDATKVGNIAQLLEFPPGLDYDHLELDTESTPYAVTVILKTDVETREHYEELLHQSAFQRNALIMFALIENMEGVNFRLSDGEDDDYSISYSRDWANDLLGEDVRRFAENKESFAEFLEMLESSGIGGVSNRVLAVVENNLDAISILRGKVNG